MIDQNTFSTLERAIADTQVLPVYLIIKRGKKSKSY